MKKFTIIALMFLIAVLLISTVAHAGIFGKIGGFVASPINAAVFAAIALVLGFVMKKIPNEKIQTVVGKFARGLGITVTLGLSKWPYTAPIWNKAVEPYIVDLIYNVPIWFLKEFIVGMKSDNKKEG